MNTKKRTSNFKFIRITILLIILASIWNHFDTQKQVVQNWNGTRDVVITPINFDNLSTTELAIQRLRKKQFNDINSFFAKQSKRYGLDLRHSINIRLSEPITEKPPALPRIGSSRWDIILWSLKLRWWAWTNKTNDSHDNQINLYVMYSTPKRGQRLPHSTGLQKGLIGLIHANAIPKNQKRNNMIITHELLHIFGATDKYNLTNGRPIFPNGYAKPDKKPLFPQNKAEIMAGRTPISETKFARIYGLSQTVIGKKTALEIGWLEPLK